LLKGVAKSGNLVKKARTGLTPYRKNKSEAVSKRATSRINKLNSLMIMLNKDYGKYCNLHVTAICINEKKPYLR
jgi:hypothetical protein